MTINNQHIISFIRHQRVLTVLCMMLALTDVSAQESQTGYNFLRLPVSAHAAALGGENITIIEDDPSLMFSNPALASSVSDRMVGLNYMNYMKDCHFLSASFTKIIKEKTTVAGGVQYVNYGKIKEVDADNRQTGEFNANDIALSGIFSYQLAKNLVGGITGKFITSQIGDYSSIAVGIDLGLNYYNPEHEWSMSAVAKNLGGEVKAYDEEYNKMPIDVQIGVSKTFQALPVRISATLVDMTHYDYRFVNHLCLGLDAFLSHQIWIGAGYQFRRADEMKIVTTDDESAHGAGLSFGAGLNLERFKLNLSYGRYHVSSYSLMINAALAI